MKDPADSFHGLLASVCIVVAVLFIGWGTYYFLTNHSKEACEFYLVSGEFFIAGSLFGGNIVLRPK